MRRKRNNLYDQILFLVYPLRDSIAFNLSSIPLRIGEIYNGIYSGILLISRKESKALLKGAPLWIIVALAVNLILTLLGGLSHWGEIDKVFFAKYSVRNLLNLILVYVVVVTDKRYSPEDLARVMRYALIIQVLFAILEFAGGLTLYLSEIVEPQYNLAITSIPRFNGTASEAAYIIPLLMMLLVYYFLKSRYMTCALVVVLALLTLSTFGYAMLALTMVYCLVKKKPHMRVKVLIGVAIFAGLLFCALYIDDGLLQSTPFGPFAEKMHAYISGAIFSGSSLAGDASTNDRLQQMQLAMEMIDARGLGSTLFGGGTGAYSVYAAAAGAGNISDAAEAYNLVLSTMCDRGILGVACLIVIIYSIWKVKTDDPVSDALFIAIVAQLLHFLLIGNMWRYYFWDEVILLIGYESWKSANRSARSSGADGIKGQKG